MKLTVTFILCFSVCTQPFIPKDRKLAAFKAEGLISYHLPQKPSERLLVIGFRSSYTHLPYFDSYHDITKSGGR